jgi:hypothetical protein
MSLRHPSARPPQLRPGFQRVRRAAPKAPHRPETLPNAEEPAADLSGLILCGQA